MARPHGIFSALAKERGLKPATFHNRVRRGWCPFVAAITPAGQYHYEWGG